jgi:class 3 adenylate cyclase
MLFEPAASHVQLAWSHPVVGSYLQKFRDGNTFVLFDARGTGLSDRVLPSAPGEWLRDLETVVDRLGLEDFALSAAQASCRTAIAYAARRPEKVRRLVLIDGYVRQRDVIATAQWRALTGTFVGDYELFTEALGPVVFGSGRTVSAVHGAYLRACVSADYYLQDYSKAERLDVADLIDQVRAPTLILHHKESRIFTTEMSRELAARIGDARLVEVEGLWADNPEGLAERVVAFVNEAHGVPESRSEPWLGVRTVLFSDLVGHTEMMRRLGDERGREVLRDHERITRQVLKDHRGAEVKTMGDGFMASFASVTKAMDCAIALQRALATHKGEPLQVRIGLNAGEPIEEDGDLFGSTVILASRIAAKADAGEILIPEPLRHLLTGKGYAYADRGEAMVKGFEDPVRLYEVRWQE